ncbi:hypothetical protein D770_24770 [Flammeovirgaceae bacterium 311]|nr:hypothetical protein D770_24770 [Flammeovirgaceae bacterium 311]
MTRETVRLKDEFKHAIPATVGYVLSIVAFFILNRLAPSGPCTPGPGILILVVLPVISFVLLIYNLIQRFRSGEPNKIVIWIHLLVFSAFLVLFMQDLL